MNITTIPAGIFLEFANEKKLGRLVTLTCAEKGTLLCEVGSVFTVEWTKQQILSAKFSAINAMHCRFSHDDKNVIRVIL